MDLMLLDETLFSGTFNDAEFFVGPMENLNFQISTVGAAAILLASKFYEPDENLMMISEI